APCLVDPGVHRDGTPRRGSCRAGHPDLAAAASPFAGAGRPAPAVSRVRSRADAGQAEDAKGLPGPAVLALRRRGLTWLRADLTVYAEMAKRDSAKANDTVRQRLGRWLKDPSLASVRDKAGLARLPEDERAAWLRLWDEVEALRNKVQERK